MHRPGNPGQQASPATGGALGRAGAARSHRSPRSAGGFTLLELQVSVAVLAIGIIGLSGLMIRQGKQIARLEAWCVPDRTYHVVKQTGWMRTLGAPAEFAESAGQDAWEPPPTSKQKDNVVTLVTFSRPGQTMSAQGTLEPNE